MLTSGKATKVTVYLSDTAKHHGVPVYTSVLDYLYKNGVAGATVTKGVAGFGLHHHIHTAHILELSDHLPSRWSSSTPRRKWRRSCRSWSSAADAA